VHAGAASRMMACPPRSRAGPRHHNPPAPAPAPALPHWSPSRSALEVLQHPAFASPRQCVEVVTRVGDAIKRATAAAPPLDAMPLPSVQPDGRVWMPAPLPRSHPHACLTHLEAAFAWYLGARCNWAARCADADRVWGVEWSAVASNGSHGMSAASAAEERKAPLQYYHAYRKRGLFAAGLLRAVRNIAFAHASDYASADDAGGAFATPHDVAAYFPRLFPWLVVECWHWERYG
jgi:hypothetical protein